MTDFDEAGDPQSMVVEEIRIFEDAGLPTVLDLAYIDFTGDEDHADFVTDLRDDD